MNSVEYTFPRESQYKFKVADDCPERVYFFSTATMLLHLYDSTTFEEAVGEAHSRTWNTWLNNPFIKDSYQWVRSHVEEWTPEALVENALTGADWMFQYGCLVEVE
ncbi:hypothetical protein VPH49_26090 [Pseudomonas luteola]|uniref:hypothetical protein n=1 Tax=Pseudomonas luteola TaxID=47886 RepID=UPI003A868D44